MPEWFDRAFGAVGQEAANGIEDVRDKLIFEAWFGRRTPEHSSRGDLGWSIDQPREPAPSPDIDQGHDFDR